jgi:hypothetical protein
MRSSFSWSDAYPWTPDEILTSVYLYRFSTAGPEASWYHYCEALHGKEIMVGVAQTYLDVPLGLAGFPMEISNAPRGGWDTLGLVVWRKTYKIRGHLTVWEPPEDLVGGKCETWRGGGSRGVIEGRSWHD